MVLTGVLLVGVTTAKSGDSVGEYQGNDVRKTCKNDDGKSAGSTTDWAIFVTCFTGIIYSGLASNAAFAGFFNRKNITDNCSSGK